MGAPSAWAPLKGPSARAGIWIHAALFPVMMNQETVGLYPPVCWSRARNYTAGLKLLLKASFHDQAIARPLINQNRSLVKDEALTAQGTHSPQTGTLSRPCNARSKWAKVQELQALQLVWAELAAMAPTGEDHRF